MTKHKLLTCSEERFQENMDALAIQGYFPFGNLVSTTKIVYDAYGKPSSQIIILHQIFVKGQNK